MSAGNMLGDMMNRIMHYITYCTALEKLKLLQIVSCFSLRRVSNNNGINQVKTEATFILRFVLDKKDQSSCYNI